MTETKLGRHPWGQLLTVSVSPAKQLHYVHKMPHANATRMLRSDLPLGPARSGRSALQDGSKGTVLMMESVHLPFQGHSVSQRSQCLLNSLPFLSGKGTRLGAVYPHIHRHHPYFCGALTLSSGVWLLLAILYEAGVLS